MFSAANVLIATFFVGRVLADEWSQPVVAWRTSVQSTGTFGWLLLSPQAARQGTCTSILLAVEDGHESCNDYHLLSHLMHHCIGLQQESKTWYEVWTRIENLVRSNLPFGCFNQHDYLSTWLGSRQVWEVERCIVCCPLSFILSGGFVPCVLSPSGRVDRLACSPSFASDDRWHCAMMYLRPVLKYLSFSFSRNNFNKIYIKNINIYDI